MSTVPNKESVARRFGFTSLLLGLASVTNLVGGIQHHEMTTGRIIFIAVTGFLSLFFAYTWWNVRRGNDL